MTITRHAATVATPTAQHRLTTPALTVKELIDGGSRQLAKSETPRLDAELILGQVLACPRSAFYSRPEWQPDSDKTEEYSRLIGLRARDIPLAYLFGRKEFWSLKLDISASVLVPRPETELLVELALSIVDARRRLRILDLGTGSGAIVLAIASERSRCTLFATDHSATALAVAKSNAAMLALNQVHFAARGSWLKPVSRIRLNRFDAIISNPPYIARGNLGLCALVHEPRAALVSRNTGYRDLFNIVDHAKNHLRAGGALILEHGARQGPLLRRRLSRQGFHRIKTHRDLAGLERASIGFKAG